MIHLTAYQKNLIRFAACGTDTISLKRKNPRRFIIIGSSSSPGYGRRIYRLLFLLFSGGFWIKVAFVLPCPVTHRFGEPIVFPFPHILFFIGECRLFRLEQDLGILSFCCFICILLLLLLLLIFCLSVSVSRFLCLFFCVLFSLSPFLCLLFCVSFSLSPFLSPFLCLLFCVSFTVSFSLCPLLCLSISLSVYCSLLLSVSVIFSGSKNNPLLDFFRPVGTFSPC